MKYSVDFEYFYSFRRYSLLKFEVVRSWVKFCMFLACKIFFGKAPEIFDVRYKIWPSTDHHAEFHRDWPTELGDNLAK